MAITAQVKDKEAFLVQVNGEYNIPFDEVKVGADFVSGDVIQDANGKVGADSTTILGIVAEEVKAGNYARVLTRGNPTSVKLSNIHLNGMPVDKASELLSAKGILVVDK